MLTRTCFRFLCAVLLTVLIPGVLLHGQEAQPKQDKAAVPAAASDLTVRKVIRVRHLYVPGLAQLFFGWASVQASQELGLISVSGTQEQVDAIERAVREFDVPEEKQSGPGFALRTFHLANVRDAPEFVQITNTIGGIVGASRSFPMLSTKTVVVNGSPEQLRLVEEVINDVNRVRAQTASGNIELTVYLLGVGDGVKSSVPEGVLQQVVSGLKKTMPYKEYRLLETLAVRTRLGEKTQIRGILPEAFRPPDLPEGEAGLPVSYEFEALANGVSSAADSSAIKFQFINLGVRVPVRHTNFEDIAINTALDIPDGKTVVVGKAGAQGSIQALFLVLTAKVVD